MKFSRRKILGGAVLGATSAVGIPALAAAGNDEALGRLLADAITVPVMVRPAVPNVAPRWKTREHNTTRYIMPYEFDVAVHAPSAPLSARVECICKRVAVTVYNVWLNHPTAVGTAYVTYRPLREVPNTLVEAKLRGTVAMRVSIAIHARELSPAEHDWDVKDGLLGVVWADATGESS